MIFRNSAILMSSKTSTPNDPIVFGNLIASKDNFLVKREGLKISLSRDSGETFNEELDITEVGELKNIYLFQNGELMVSNHTQTFYSEDWETLYESAIYDIDGSPFVPESPTDNFSTFKTNKNRQIVDGQELWCWGNYTQNHNNIRVWYTIDNGKTIKCCFKFKETIPINDTDPTLCRHVHSVDFNPADNTFWIQTGDEPTTRDSHWIKGTYNLTLDTWEWERIGTGDNYKTSNMVFQGDYIYYAWDISFGGVARVKYDEVNLPEKHELVFATPNDCIGIYQGERGDMVVFLTNWGGSKRASTLFYSPDLINFYEIQGVLPTELDYHDTIYYSHWAVNSNGKLLSGIYAKDVMPLSEWERMPSVWIDDIIKRQGFPDALKPIYESP